MQDLKLSKEKEIELFVLCIWLFLLRIAIPYVTYLFVPYFILFIAYTIIKILRVYDINQFKIYYFRVFSAFLLVCLFFLTGILLSSRLYFSFLKEGLTMFVIMGIGIMAFTFIESEDDFKISTRKFMRQLLVFCIFICFFSLVKTFFLLRGVTFEFLYDYRGFYPKGTSLVIDYNFYALLNIIGIVTVSYLLVKERSVLYSVLLQLLVFCLIMDVMFSTSRRGIIALVIILLFLFFVLLLGWLAGKGTWMAILSRKLRFVFIFFFGFLFSLLIFLSQKPFHSKSSQYVNLGFDRVSGRDLLYLCAVRYFSIIDPQSKNTAMGQYFERFRKTGEVGSLNNLIKVNKKAVAQISRDTLKANNIKEGSGQDYFKVILWDPDNRFSGGRIQRVNYAIKIFSEQYSTSKKFIGGGFDYLWDFGHAFYYKNNHRFYFDYPHNPVISAFLYSGILGGLSLVYFFCMTFLNFIRSFRSLIYFIFLYVIVFFFAFFSGNSIFGSPEFLFFSLVPFYFTLVKYRCHPVSTVILEE
jgi:hypothetical protein